MVDYFPLLIALLAGLGLLLFPLFGNWRLMSFVGICCFMLAIGTYLQVGGWHELENYKQAILNKENIAAALKKFKGIPDLITKLKLKVTADPTRDEGWYLLGRLYLNHQDWHEARLAFTKAKDLKPADIKYQINYGLALFNEQNRQYSAEIITLFENILKQDPNQPDTLMMLGQAECHKKNYKKGLEYLRKLLTLLPADSNEAKIVEESIINCSL